MTSWQPTWTIRFLGWLIGPSRLESLVRWLVFRAGVWDAKEDGGFIYWNLTPWKNNMRRMIRLEKKRIVSKYVSLDLSTGEILGGDYPR